MPIPTNVTSQAQPILALHVGYHLFLRNNSLIYSLMLVGDASNIIHGPVARVIINVFRSLCIVGKVIYFSLNLKILFVNIPGDAECWRHLVRQNVKQELFSPPLSLCFVCCVGGSDCPPVFHPQFPSCSV